MDYLKCSAKWKLDKLLLFMPPNGTVIQMNMPQTGPGMPLQNRFITLYNPRFALGSE